MLLARYTSSANGCLRVIPGSHLKRHPLHDPPRRAHDSDEVGTAANLEHPALQPAAGEVDEPVRADRRCRFPPRCSAAKRRRRRPRPNAATGGRRPMSTVDQAAPEDRSTLPAIRPTTTGSRVKPGTDRGPLRTTSAPRAANARRVVAAASHASRASERDRRKVGLTTDGYTLSLPTPSASFGRPMVLSAVRAVAGTLGSGAALIVVQVRSGPCVMPIDEVICTFGQASSYPQIRHHQRSAW